jgi:hypothetical protein
MCRARRPFPIRNGTLVSYSFCFGLANDEIQGEMKEGAGPSVKKPTQTP